MKRKEKVQTDRIAGRMSRVDMLVNAIFNNNLANEILSELQWSDGTVLASQSPDLLLVGF